MVLAVLAGPVAAQQPAGDEFRRLEPATADDTGFTLEVWQPIDQRVEDLGLLNYSLRIVEPGLEQPNDFNQVYRLPGSQDRFIRVQGAIHAVFPQSAYSRTREGQTLAHIPAGTEFYIGSPSAGDDDRQNDDAVNQNTLGTLPPQASELRWNTRIAPLAPGANGPERPGAQAGGSGQHAGRGPGEQRQRHSNAGQRMYSTPDRDAFEQHRLTSTGPVDRHAERSPSPRRELANGDETARDRSEDVLPRLRADEAYRRQRLRELLSRAASAAQNSTGR